MLRKLVFCCLLAGCARPAPKAEPQLGSPTPNSVVVFEGMCDASGAIAIDAKRFAIADDEENSIRIYDAERGGAPLAV
ncbi:MAG TPA: hypothetical protein VNN80_26510, partial [Polyangiaceae bacterium]|nr:hypothetical protein [Polyangiaceae bacterium]